MEAFRSSESASVTGSEDTCLNGLMPKVGYGDVSFQAKLLSMFEKTTSKESR